MIMFLVVNAGPYFTGMCYINNISELVGPVSRDDPGTKYSHNAYKLSPLYNAWISKDEYKQE